MRKDGRSVEVSLSIYPIKSPEGAIIGASKTVRDITESRRTQHALRQQIEERRRIFETSQDLILVIDPKGSPGSGEPQRRNYPGIYAGRNDRSQRERIPAPDDLEISQKEMRLARRGQRAQNTDSRYVHKDGRIVMLSWMGTWSEPVRRYFFVGRDMTESRLAQETLRESEQLARGIIDTALDAFVQIDESGSILNWNSQAEKIFGWPRKDALGKNFIELIIAESERGELKAALDRFLRSGQGQILGNRREIRALRRDGKDFPAELSVTALRRREGILFAASSAISPTRSRRRTASGDPKRSKPSVGSPAASRTISTIS